MRFFLDILVQLAMRTDPLLRSVLLCTDPRQLIGIYRLPMECIRHGNAPRHIPPMWDPMRGAVSGVSGASPIWNVIMKAVLDKAEDGYYDSDQEGHAWPQQPDDVVGKSVCWITGKIAGSEGDPGCSTRFEYFLSDSLPSITVEQRDVVIDKSTGALANKDIPPELLETQGHQVLTDPLGTLYCLDCPNPLPAWNTIVSYPSRLF